MKSKLLASLIFWHAFAPCNLIANQNDKEETQDTSYKSWESFKAKDKNNFLTESQKKQLFEMGVGLIFITIATYIQIKLVTYLTSTPEWDIITPGSIKESFQSVAGAHEAKEALIDIVKFLKNPKYYRRLGAKIPKGILLTGNPGTGKTLLARALAGKAQCNFISVSGSAFVQMYVGVGAARVRSLFQAAAQHAPCIIFIDEFDALAPNRHSTENATNQEHKQTVNQLLACMDGLLSQDANHPILVIGATNHESAIDPAVLRPGRFDRIIHVAMPNLQDRIDILNIHLNKVTHMDNIDIETIAARTPGFSGADLQNLVNQATLIATKEELDAVDTDSMYQALDLITLGAPAQNILMSDYEKATTAYHEAGHALMHILLPEISDQLHGVTIIPRNKALGVTYSLPNEHKYTLNKEEMLAKICMLLAGRAAEELMFGEISTGAYSDFQKATDIAYDMVCFYGMTDTLGKRIYNSNISEIMQNKIDIEISKILDEQYERVIMLLSENKELLIKLAENLLEKETMYAPEIYEILGITEPCYA